MVGRIINAVGMSHGYILSPLCVESDVPDVLPRAHHIACANNKRARKGSICIQRRAKHSQSRLSVQLGIGPLWSSSSIEIASGFFSMRHLRRMQCRGEGLGNKCSGHRAAQPRENKQRGPTGWRRRPEQEQQQHGRRGGQIRWRKNKISDYDTASRVQTACAMSAMPLLAEACPIRYFT